MNFLTFRKSATRSTASLGQKIANGSSSQQSFNVGKCCVELGVQRAEIEMIGPTNGAMLDTRYRFNRIDNIEHRQFVRVDRQSDPAPLASLRGNDVCTA